MGIVLFHEMNILCLANLVEYQDDLSVSETGGKQVDGMGVFPKSSDKPECSGFHGFSILITCRSFSQSLDE